MKRKILISTLLFLTGLVTHAQDLDIKPSQQAQGILESKNAMVDHATGLFHYKVPLYEIKSGNFTLPISLDYVAKGVKVNDQPGLVGYNWSLNTGGVVTRTIRGGIADENENGYACNSFTFAPATDEISLVNKKLIDGEADIFSASFNGQTIQFMIKKDDYNFFAIPLQRTNIKIEILGTVHPLWGVIDGFNITDDFGNKYIFMQKEMVKNLSRDGLTGVNGIYNKKYTSSWYLSKIEPLNTKPIIYKYFEDVNNENDQSEINRINYFQRYSICYNYGSPVVEYPFNFSKYKANFDMCINAAKRCLNQASIFMQLDNQIVEIENGKLIRNPFWESNVGNIGNNFKIIGLLSDFSKISNASNGVIETLNYLIRECERSSNSIIQSAAIDLKNAKNIMKECISERIYVNKKESYQDSHHSIRTPLLEQIECGGEIIEFSYIGGQNNIERTIDEINLLGIYNQKIRSLKLNDVTSNDGKISYLDKNNNEYDYIKFNYHGIPTDGYITDIWGYNKQGNPNDDSKYQGNVDGDYAKYKSLSRISKKSGTVIEIDYESNQVNSEQMFYPEGFGGIRLKNIIFKSDQTSIPDIIKYSYPEAGVSVFKSCRNNQTVRCSTLADIFVFNYIMNEGNAWINTGNNGLYYPYVQEEFVGKGKYIYSFNVSLGEINLNRYPYWLVGLPLARATYDVNDKLTNVVKYNYYENLASGFLHSSDSIKSIAQIKAYEFYVNKEIIEAQFRNQTNILLYESVYINIFNEVYTRNLLPRTLQILPDNRYNLYYGGRALLKEKIEYTFENDDSTPPAKIDFNRTSPNYKKILYHYNDVYKDIYPTKIFEINSDGSQNTEIVKRVADITDNKTLINDMKSRNMYGTVIKTQKQVKRSGTNNCQLLEEKVYEYTQNTVEGKSFMVMDKIHTYSPDVITNITLDNNNMFSYEKSKYLTEKYSYKYEDGKCLPVHIENINAKVLLNYDFINGNNIILKSPHLNNNSAMSVDYHKYRITSEASKFMYEYRNIIRSVYDTYIRLDFSNCTPEFIGYKNSPGSQNIIKIIKNIAIDENRMNYTEIRSLINKYLRDQDIKTFMNYHRGELKNVLQQHLYDIVYLDKMQKALNSIKDMGRDGYNAICYMGTEISAHGITVTNVPLNKNYKLYILSDITNSSSVVNCIISHSNTSVSQTISIPSQLYSKLYVFEVDISNYNNISKLFIDGSSNHIKYMTLVPEDAEFDATSYNADGTVFCKFNQNGQLERYEYDAAGRVVKVYDNDNNLLKEFKYNVAL